MVADGQGRAHPRRFGLACHLGVLLDLPTIGCAKSRLVGQHREPGPRRGAATQLRDGGEVIGTVHGVDEDGALLVEPDGGPVERVLAGDVTLLRGGR